MRMIVLLHAFNLGFGAFDVALMFVLYELMGVVTNFVAGIFGSLWGPPRSHDSTSVLRNARSKRTHDPTFSHIGLKSTLLFGLVLQIISISMLFFWDPTFTKEEGIVFVTCAQVQQPFILTHN